MPVHLSLAVDRDERLKNSGKWTGYSHRLRDGQVMAQPTVIAIVFRFVSKISMANVCFCQILIKLPSNYFPDIG